MAKTTTITLIVKAENIEREFEISHAERLLAMPNNGGWEIKDKNKYKFSQEYGIERVTNQRPNNE